MPDEFIQPQAIPTLPAPVARGLSNWPVTPPPFDPVDLGAAGASATGAADVPTIEDLATLIERLTVCGVSAARHDSPDLLAQLHVALKRPIDTVICSVLDVDPAACVQSAWAAQHGENLVAGVNV